MGIEHMMSCSLDVSSPSCVILTVARLSFEPLLYAWQKLISSEKASKIYYTGDLHSQLPSNNLHLDLGTMKKMS